MDTQCVVIGIGNPCLQDDRAGVAVAERLQAMQLPCHIEVVCSVGLEVMDRVRGFKRAIIVDACMLGNAPGSILEVTMDDICSTQALVNSHAITLGATLKTGYLCFPEEMPTELHILLIEVQKIEKFSHQMSPEIEQAVADTVVRVQQLLAAMG